MNPSLRTISAAGRRLALPSAAVTTALALSACGSSGQTTTSTGHPPGRSQNDQMLRFTDCVRSHGVSSVPDPGTPGWKAALGSQARAVRAAERTCQRLVPGVMPANQSPAQTQTPAQISATLAFARCIRKHGFPTFPDPTSTGQLTHAMITAAGINLHQPAVIQAADACVSVTHGIITEGAVARFIAGQ